MKKKKERTFVVVYQQETDGAISIGSKTTSEIVEMLKILPADAFAIFDGKCLKTFDSKFDIGRLK